MLKLLLTECRPMSLFRRRAPCSTELGAGRIPTSIMMYYLASVLRRRRRTLLAHCENRHGQAMAKATINADALHFTLLKNGTKTLLELAKLFDGSFKFYSCLPSHPNKIPFILPFKTMPSEYGMVGKELDSATL